MWATGRRVASMAALAVLGAAGPAIAEDLPITDAHLHYSQNSRQDYTPAAVLALLDQAGVRRAFVSSTPDENTVQLYEAAPDRIVPVLRPYRQPGELGTWHLDPTVVPYLEQRLARPIYRGIGEFHLSGSDARAPVVRQVAELAARHRLFLHCHCDAEAAEILLGLAPGVRVLWAHAGMSSGPDEVSRLVGASTEPVRRAGAPLGRRARGAAGSGVAGSVRAPSRPLHGGNRHLGRLAMGEPRRRPGRRPDLAWPAPARSGAPLGVRQR